MLVLCGINWPILAFKVWYSSNELFTSSFVNQESITAAWVQTIAQ